MRRLSRCVVFWSAVLCTVLGLVGPGALRAASNFANDDQLIAIGVKSKCGCCKGCTCGPNCQCGNDHRCCNDCRCGDYNYDYDYDCDWDDDCCCPDPWGYGNPCDPDWWYYPMLLPNCPTLFPQFMASPRAVNMSAGWRFNDQVFEKNMIDVSYGGPVPLVRWFDVLCCGDAMQLDLEGALWAIFDPLHDSSPLVNADYYIGFPLTWACGCWSWRLRGYHISSHIGDEFLLNHPKFVRLNPSAQYLDFFAAYQMNEWIRLFAGYGRIFQVDPSFPVKRNYIDWGADVYLPYFNWDACCYSILGRPFFGMYFHYWQENDWHQDATFTLGYELMKLSGMQGKLRAFLEYHTGFSWEGQFAREDTDYLALRMSYGY